MGTTKIEVAKIGEKTWRAITTCKEIPAMNEIYVLDEDKEVCFDDNVMGGTNKMKITMPNENTMKIISDHSKMGKSETHEVQRPGDHHHHQALERRHHDGELGQGVLRGGGLQICRQRERRGVHEDLGRGHEGDDF